LIAVWRNGRFVGRFEDRRIRVMQASTLARFGMVSIGSLLSFAKIDPLIADLLRDAQ
jgi:hypothetical protein